jgi:hypothetical protein
VAVAKGADCTVDLVSVGRTVRSPRVFVLLSPWRVSSTVGGAQGTTGIRRVAVGMAPGVSWVVVVSIGAAWCAMVPDARVVV